MLNVSSRKVFRISLVKAGVLDPQTYKNDLVDYLEI